MDIINCSVHLWQHLLRTMLLCFGRNPTLTKPRDGKCSWGAAAAWVVLRVFWWFYYILMSSFNMEVMGCRSVPRFPQGWVGDAGPFLAQKALNWCLLMGLRKSRGSLLVLDGDSFHSEPRLKQHHMPGTDTRTEIREEFPKLRTKNNPFTAFLVIKRPKIKRPALIFPGRRKE